MSVTQIISQHNFSIPAFHQVNPNKCNIAVTQQHVKDLNKNEGNCVAEPIRAT